jgi:glycosyltransferase involved in cell wall biosynthesis
MHVCIVPEYPVSLMTGGLQVQAEETYRALARLDGAITAGLFNWSEQRPLADVYHFIGFPSYLQQLTKLVRDAGRPYLLTLLFGGGGEPVQLWMARARQLLNSQVLRRRQRYNEIVRAAAVITIIEGEAEAARSIYGLDPNRVHVVPNGINDSFFDASPEPWWREFGKQPFILCVGAVQARKNQLLLLDVANHLRLPVVLLGPVLPGEQVYGQQVAIAAKANEIYGGRWLKHLRNEDSLLVSAYAACRLFALLSSIETQPLSVMQAMAVRKPILLLRAAYVQDILFRHLPKAESAAPQVVAAALKNAWSTGEATELSREYSWLEVARRLQVIYRSCSPRP